MIFGRPFASLHIFFLLRFWSILRPQKKQILFCFLRIPPLHFDHIAVGTRPRQPSSLIVGLFKASFSKASLLYKETLFIDCWLVYSILLRHFLIVQGNSLCWLLAYQKFQCSQHMNLGDKVLWLLLQISALNHWVVLDECHYSWNYKVKVQNEIHRNHTGKCATCSFALPSFWLLYKPLPEHLVPIALCAVYNICQTTHVYLLQVFHPCTTPYVPSCSAPCYIWPACTRAPFRQRPTVVRTLCQKRCF